MWRDETFLVVRKGEVFPDRCIKSNRPAHGRRVQQVAEQIDAMPFLVHLWNPIAGALMALIAHSVVKRVTFTVGLSDEWHRKRRRAYCLAGAIIVVSFATLAYGTALIGRGADLGVWVVSIGILGTLGGLLYGLNASTLVMAKRIANDYFWLRGVHPDFVADFPEWPGEALAGFDKPSDTSEWQ